MRSGEFRLDCNRMVLRLLLILMVALVVAPGMSTSADAVAAIEHDVGETTIDLDEAQLAVGDVVPEQADRAAPQRVPQIGAPVPPFRHGVFRPPRVAFD